MSIQDLLALHRLDIRIQALTEFLDTLPEKGSALAAARQEAVSEVEHKRQALENIRKDLRKEERNLQDGEERLKQIQAKLNQVKTNKEYEAALKEIEEQRRKNSGLEEEIIRLFDEVEEADGAIKEQEQEWEEKTADFEALETELAARAVKAESELGEKRRRRAEVVALIPADFLKTYERVSSFQRRALARADKEVCHGCYFHIPAQRYNMVLKGQELICCPNCQRILVYTETEIEEGLVEITP